MIFLFVILIFFQLNLDETCFLCNEVELNIIGVKRHSKPWGVKEVGDTGHIRAWPG